MLIGLMIVGLLLSPFMDSIMDFRTDEPSESYTVATGAGATTANVTLSNTLWDDDTSSISMTSNATLDSPTVSAYNTSTRVLTVAGLQASTSRTLTVTYSTEGLADYAAADTAVEFSPVILVAAMLALPVILIVVAVKGR